MLRFARNGSSFMALPSPITNFQLHRSWSPNTWYAPDFHHHSKSDKVEISRTFLMKKVTGVEMGVTLMDGSPDLRINYSATKLN